MNVICKIFQDSRFKLKQKKYFSEIFIISSSIDILHTFEWINTFCSFTFFIEVIEIFETMMLVLVFFKLKIVTCNVFYYYHYVAEISNTYIKRKEKHILFLYFFDRSDRAFRSYKSLITVLISKLEWCGFPYWN